MFIFLPFSLVFYSFRSCGFLHLWRHRAIGNVNFIDFEDAVIINLFKLYKLFLYYWYNICFNNESLHFFFRLLKESCLLTLARKHKKNKTWTYDIYYFDVCSLHYDLFKDLRFYAKFLNTGNFLFNNLLNEFK